MSIPYNFKIKCLVCGDIIAKTVHTDRSEDLSCSCSNNVHFTYKSLFIGWGATANDKTKAQFFDEDKNEWLYFITPEDENTPRYKRWYCALGGNETHGMLEGCGVYHEFEEELTLNEAKKYLKNNVVKHEDGRIYHIIFPDEKN